MDDVRFWNTIPPILLLPFHILFLLVRHAAHPVVISIVDWDDCHIQQSETRVFVVEIVCCEPQLYN